MQSLEFITLGVHIPIHLTKLVNINSHYISSSQERTILSHSIKVMAKTIHYLMARESMLVIKMKFCYINFKRHTKIEKKGHSTSPFFFCQW